VVCRAESFISVAGGSSATVAVGQPVVENTRHGGDQSVAIALAGGTVGELDGSRQRSFDRKGMRPSAGDHRRGRPYGEAKWVREAVRDLGLEQTVRQEGRPRKASKSATEALSELRGFRPAVRSIDKLIASLFPSREDLCRPFARQVCAARLAGRSA
jgi:hypothetical protein